MTEHLIHILIDSLPKILLPGVLVTIPLTLISFTFAMLIATFCAMALFSKVPILKHIIRFYVWVIRGTPLLIQLYVVFFGFPKLGIIVDSFLCAVIVFSLNEGAYCTETMRSALEAVPKGQMEAGFCVGMSYFQIMRRIILPQALRTAFPPLSNSFIGMIKDTSLAANITVMEMFMQTQRIVARTYEPLALYIELALIYLLFSTVLTKVQRYCENNINKKTGN